jgi:hypothetical protein
MKIDFASSTSISMIIRYDIQAFTEIFSFSSNFPQDTWHETKLKYQSWNQEMETNACLKMKLDKERVLRSILFKIVQLRFSF